jgi:Flp pilus assembly protein TadG
MAVACLKTRRAGSAAIEFAIVGPLLIVILMGMVIYGGWFWLAQSVQSVASESARAAVGGLDDAERQAMAEAFFGDIIDDTTGLNPAKASVTVQSDADVIRVQVTYDASDHPVMAMAGLIPSPSATIQRQAIVRIGGY